MRARAPWAVLGAVSVGLVLGFALGGVAPRVDLQERDEEIVRLRDALANAEPASTGWRSPVPGLDRILRAPPEEYGEEDRGARRDEDDSEPREDLRPREAVPVTDGGVGGDESWRERWRERGVDERMDTFRRAASLQRVRRLQSRAALFEQADLDETEQAAVDAALAEMNEALLGHGEELLVLAAGDEPPAARDLLGITHDVTGILHRAQLSLEGVLGETRAAAVDPSALEVWNHVDLGQLEPAARAALAGPR